jgi:hypothetical protein
MMDDLDDTEYFYNMCDRMNKMATEAQLEAFLEEVKDKPRVKAFVIAMRL